MSIVTLKKKSHATHFKISNKKGFNLNGKINFRSSSFVGGSSSYTNTINRTRFKGLHGIGHGGCCGKYKHDVSNSGYCFMETDKINTFGKKSVKNTKGYLSTKNYWLNSPYPCNIVQPTNRKDYSVYYSEITNCNGCKTSQSDDSGCSSEQFNISNNCNAQSKPLNMSQVKKNLNINNYNKKIYPEDQGVYISTTLKCNKCLPPPPEKREFPLAYNNSGCNVQITSHSQAINMNLYN